MARTTNSKRSYCCRVTGCAAAQSGKNNGPFNTIIMNSNFLVYILWPVGVVLYFIDYPLQDVVIYFYIYWQAIIKGIADPQSALSWRYTTLAGFFGQISKSPTLDLSELATVNMAVKLLR